MPVDNLTKKPKGFAFVDFSHSVSGEYAIHLLNDTPMFGKPMTVRHSHRGGGSTTGKTAVRMCVCVCVCVCVCLSSVKIGVVTPH